jgi:hypothetical protein
VEKLHSLLKLIIIGCATVVLFGCKDPVEPQKPVYSVLTVLSPKTGDVTMVGDTILVKWAYPADWPYSQVRIQLYGQSGLASLGEIHKPVDFPVDTAFWVVKGAQVSTDCYVFIQEYNNQDEATSGLFTVKN